MMTVSEIISNGKSVKQLSQAVAFAIELVTGKSAKSVCVWCSDRLQKPTKQREYYYALGGDCCMCNYSGRDIQIVVSSNA